MKIILGDNDVISTQKDKSPVSALTFKVNEIHVYLHNKISRDIGTEAADKWVFQGLPCEVLMANGGGWQSGKVWVCLEFTPDGEEEIIEEIANEPVKALPEPPLDDLRAELLDSD